MTIDRHIPIGSRLDHRHDDPLRTNDFVVQVKKVATETPGPDSIPKSGSSGQLDVGWLQIMVGDSGSGGAAGLVPAPAAGDAAADYFLKADGTWAAPPGAGGGEANTSSNLGAGAGLAATKVGVDLPFKSLVAGTNISIGTSATEVTINSTGGGVTSFEGRTGVVVSASGDYTSDEITNASAIPGTSSSDAMEFNLFLAAYAA